MELILFFAVGFLALVIFGFSIINIIAKRFNDRNKHLKKDMNRLEKRISEIENKLKA